MSIINKTRYIRDLDTNSKVGVITLVYDKGHFGLGVSLCNSKADKFNRDKGKEIAYSRAIECLSKTPMLLKDINSIDVERMETLAGFKFPKTTGCLKTTYEASVKVFSTWKAYCLLIDDMVYTLALSKVRAETE